MRLSNSGYSHFYSSHCRSRRGGNHLPRARLKPMWLAALGGQINRRHPSVDPARKLAGGAQNADGLKGLIWHGLTFDCANGLYVELASSPDKASARSYQNNNKISD